MAGFWLISISGNLAQSCLKGVSSEGLNLNFVMVDMSPSLVLKVRKTKCRLYQSWFTKVVFVPNMSLIDTHMDLKY